MKCVKIVSSSSPLLVSEEKLPLVPEFGAIIKVAYAGLCHTDVHVWHDGYSLGNGKFRRFSDQQGFSFPRIPGHEISGYIHKLGSGVNFQSEHCLKEGDPVAVYPWIGCDQCKACKEGLHTMCKGQSQSLGFFVDGGFAEYVSVPNTKYLLGLSGGLLPVGCMLGCNALTVYSAFKKATPFVKQAIDRKETCTVLIIGVGGLGLWALSLARELLPHGTLIVCIDKDEEKLSLATESGSNHVFHCPSTITDSCLEEQVKKANSSFIQGIHIALDFVGTSDTFNIAMKCLRKDGLLEIIGLHGGTATFALPPFALAQYTITGVHTGTLQQMKELLDIFESKRIDPPKYTLHQLHQAPNLIENLAKGKSKGKSIFKIE